jgi:hypothetical protein
MLGSFRALASDPATRSTLINAGIWLLIGTQVNFNNHAHIGGLVAGALVTAVIVSPRRRVLAPLLASAFAALFLLAAKPGWKPTGAALDSLIDWGNRWFYAAGGFPSDRARGARMLKIACAAGDGSACDAGKEAP